MDSKLINRLNELLCRDTEKDIIIHINTIFKTVPKTELLRINSIISEEALNNIYLLLKDIDLSEDIKEHIIWAYYKNKLKSRKEITNELLERLQSDYQQYKYIALESIGVDLLKKVKLNNDQVERIKTIFNTKTINKIADQIIINP